MKIVIAASFVFGAGGIRRVIESWARILGEAGHDVVVLSQGAERAKPLPPIPGVRNEMSEGVESRSGRIAKIFRGAQTSLAKLKELEERDGIDLIMTHDSMLAYWIRGAFPGVPVLCSFHSPLVEENRLNNWKYAPGIKRKLSYPATRLMLSYIDRQALRSIDCAHTLSDYTWRLLRARYPRECAAVRWEMIPGTYNDRKFVPHEDRMSLRAELGLSPDERILLTVRRQIPRNGLDRILRAARELRGRFPDAKYLIGGRGDIREQLERRIESEGLGETVKMLGFIPEEQLAAYYQTADVFLLPTRDLECFGLPVIEAMGCGCPTLVMPDGGPAEVCEKYPHFVADSNTDEAFVALVGRYLAGEIPAREPGIEEYARKHYAEQAIRPSILGLVEELCRNASNARERRGRQTAHRYETP